MELTLNRNRPAKLHSAKEPVSHPGNGKCRSGRAKQAPGDQTSSARYLVRRAWALEGQSRGRGHAPVSTSLCSRR